MKRPLYEAAKRKSRCRKNEEEYLKKTKNTKQIIIKKEEVPRQIKKLKIKRVSERAGIQNTA